MYRMKHPRSKKSARISEAVFRGEKSLYSFEVYPLTAQIADTPAVFIFSRRQTDRFGSGHHASICIGETDSILAEIKRHKRARCVKRTAANAVCVLREVSESARESIIEDLTAVRSFSCVRNADEPNIKPRPPIIAPAPRRVYAPKPVETDPAEAAIDGTEKRANAQKRARAKARSGTTVKPAVPKRKRARAAKVSAKGVAPKARKFVEKVAAKSRRAAAIAAPGLSASARPKASKSKASSNRKTASRRKVAAEKRVGGPTKRSAEIKAKRSAKRAAAAAGARIQGSVDSNDKQHRLSKPKRPAARRAKARAARDRRSRQKAAA